MWILMWMSCTRKCSRCITLLPLIMPTGEGKVKNYLMTAGLALTIHILLHLAAIQTIYLSPLLHSLLLDVIYINTSHNLVVILYYGRLILDFSFYIVQSYQFCFLILKMNSSKNNSPILPSQQNDCKGKHFSLLLQIFTFINYIIFYLWIVKPNISKFTSSSER